MVAMALSNFEPRPHTTRNGTEWQIIDLRLKRRLSDGHFTFEARGADGKPGMFRTANDTDAVLSHLRQLLRRIESL